MAKHRKPEQTTGNAHFVPLQKNEINLICNSEHLYNERRHITLVFK